MALRRDGAGLGHRALRGEVRAAVDDASRRVDDGENQSFILAGAVLGVVGWRQVYQGHGQLVRSGLYRRVRHPQYAGFFLFLLGSSINWPTLLTLLMLPVLLMMYYRLARQEEADALAQFGDEYRRYQATSGMFWPGTRI